jgi:cytoskeletal protein CcmA (bactofilin family)
MNEIKSSTARPATAPAAARKETTIEEGTTFRGAISSDCGIVVKGGLEGEVTGPSLHVSSTGFVAGTVKVGELHSEGELSGEFDAEIVRLSGRVKDKTVIRARSIDVKLKPAVGKMEVVFGECAVEVGDVPNKEDAIRSAKEPSVTALPGVAPVEQAAPPDAAAEPQKAGKGEKAEKPEKPEKGDKRSQPSAN